MRKLIILAVLFVLAAGFVFASGQQGTETMAEAEQVDLLWYIWDDPEAQGHNEIAAEFMRRNPKYNLEISRTPFGRYEETMRTILAGGDTPDVIQVNDDHVKFYAFSGWLTDLNDIASGWTIKREDTYTNFWDFNFYEGDMVSVTPAVKVRLHYYNADLFREAGLSLPPTDWENPNWTWETALEAGKKLTKTEGARTTVWGWSVNNDVSAASTWIDNNIPGPNDQYNPEGTQFMAAEPAGWRALQWVVDLTNVHKVQPPWGINKDGDIANNMFLTGQMAMYASGSWQVPALADQAEFDWRGAPHPMKIEGHSQASLVCYGVPADAKSHSDSGVLANFLMEEFTAKLWAENGFAIPVVKEYANKYYAAGEQAAAKQIIADGLEVAYPPVFSVTTAKAKSLWDATYKEIWAGERPAREIVKEVEPEIEEILNSTP